MWRALRPATQDSKIKDTWRTTRNSGIGESWRQAATKNTEYRVESGERGHRRKQREPTSTNNRHREQLGHRAGQRSFLDHVAENHMFGGKEGKSFFKATKLCDIWSLVHRTLTCPDEQSEDKSNKDRLLVKKTFHTPIGVHGFTRANCYTVKVVYDQLKRRPITAYPIHP